MSRADEERVADILDACALLEEIVAQGREAFHESRILLSAVERQVEIIGVAAGGLSGEAARHIPEATVSKAKAMRNFIAYAYFMVDHNAVWKTISEDVPELAALLASQTAPNPSRGQQPSEEASDT